LNCPASRRKNLQCLDQQTAGRIARFLDERIAKLEDPRSIGQALKGSKLGELRRDRVGDYRIIADIQDGALTHPGDPGR
jgi:mRNA interferase RelE/StbE